MADFFLIPFLYRSQASRHILTRSRFCPGAVMKATMRARRSMLDIITVIDDSSIQQAGRSNQAQRLRGLQGSRPKS